MGIDTHVVFIKCFSVTFSLTAFPPHVPQPRLGVIGIPLLKDPAFAAEFGCLIMIRLTGAAKASS